MDFVFSFALVALSAAAVHRLKPEPIWAWVIGAAAMAVALSIMSFMHARA